ncbi:DcrB-related protein [Blastococcus sp. SYSU D00813]
MSGPTQNTSRLRAAVPEGWSVTESWTLRAPDGQADVVVTREPLPPDVGTEQYAQGRGDRLAAEYPQYQQHALTVVPLASGPAYARLFSWTASGGTRVVQVQVCATAGGTGVTATATAPAASYGSVAEVLDGVLRSVALDLPAAPAPEPEPAPVPAEPVDPAPVPVEPVEPAPAAELVAPEPEPGPPPAGEPEPPAPPATGSTSATVMVQLPPRPPSPPSPPRPQP